MTRDVSTPLYLLSGVIALATAVQVATSLLAAADLRHAVQALDPRPQLTLPALPLAPPTDPTVAPADEDVPASPVLHLGTDALGRRALCLRGQAFDVPGDGTTALVARLPAEPAPRDKDGRPLPREGLRCIEAGEPLPRRTQSRPAARLSRNAMLA